MDQREQLSHTIYVAIRTAPKRVRKGISSTLAVEGDSATDELTRRIVDALSNYEIVATGRHVGDASTRGRV